MLIEMGNVWARLVDASADEYAILADYVSCEDTRYTPAMAGVWLNGEKPPRCLLDRGTGKFPAGLAIGLKAALARVGVTVKFTDTRVKPCVPDLDPALYAWLRDYQVEALKTVVKRGGRGVVKAPTGSGKSELIVALTRVYPCEWLAAVHRADLVAQTAARFELRTGERAGTFERGEWKRGTSNLTVATFQGILAAMKKRLPSAKELVREIGGLNVDEVHSQGATSYYRVSMALTNAYYRVGQSGTPLDRGDFDSLRTMGALGPLLHEISTLPLIQNGTLSKPTIRMATCRHDAAVGAEWRDVYRDFVVHAVERNEVLAKMAHRAQKPCMLFVDEMAHGEALQTLLRARGLNVAFATGSDDLPARKRKIREMVDGGTDVLICTVIFQEGVDIPELASVVVGSGKSSTVACLQRIGRGMRTFAGKGGFEVWDCWDVGQRWLLRHAHARREAYESEGHDVEIVADM